MAFIGGADLGPIPSLFFGGLFCPFLECLLSDDPNADDDQGLGVFFSLTSNTVCS